MGGWRRGLHSGVIKICHLISPLHCIQRFGHSMMEPLRRGFQAAKRKHPSKGTCVSSRVRQYVYFQGNLVKHKPWRRHPYLKSACMSWRSRFQPRPWLISNGIRSRLDGVKFHLPAYLPINYPKMFSFISGQYHR